MLSYWSRLAGAPALRSVCSNSGVETRSRRWIRISSGASTRKRQGWMFAAEEKGLEEEEEKAKTAAEVEEEATTRTDKDMWDDRGVKLDKSLGEEGGFRLMRDGFQESDAVREGLEAPEPRPRAKLVVTRLPPKSYELSVAATARYGECRFNKSRPLVLIEGRNMIAKLLDSGISPRSVFFSAMSQLRDITFPNYVRLYQVPYSEIKFWSANRQNSGLFGTYNIFDLQREQKRQHVKPFTIICDNIRNESYLAHIIMAANATACKQVLFTKGCGSIYSTPWFEKSWKACLNLPLRFSQLWDEIREEIPRDANFLIVEPPEESSWKQEASNGRAPSFRNATDSNNVRFIPKVSCFTDLFRDGKEVVVVLGTATSKAAYDACREMDGKRIFVPSNNGGALDLPHTFTIVGYELWRQWEARQGASGESSSPPSGERVMYQGVGLYTE